MYTKLTRYLNDLITNSEIHYDILLSKYDFQIDWDSNRFGMRTLGLNRHYLILDYRE